MADLKPQHSEEPQQKERDLAGHLRNTQDAAARARANLVAPKSAAVAAANAAIGDDFQLKTAYDHLKAWQIFARPGAPAPGNPGGGSETAAAH
jgi:hypothetical protein